MCVLLYVCVYKYIFIPYSLLSVALPFTIVALNRQRLREEIYFMQRISLSMSDLHLLRHAGLLHRDMK